MARIDEFLGDPQIESRHEKRVVASPRDVFRAALQLDISAPGSSALCFA